MTEFHRVALPVGHPFTGVHDERYWSSTTNTPNPNNAWYVRLYDGGVLAGGKGGSNVSVWPVRGGR